MRYRSSIWLPARRPSLDGTSAAALREIVTRSSSPISPRSTASKAM